MANILKPMLDKDASSILICWGEKECCHIVPVIVADSADEVTAWREISRAFYAFNGSWRRYILAFGVKQVDVVEISIAGRKLEINNQQATLNTLAYIKARTISPKGKTWSRSSKITSLEEDMFETEDQQKASDPKKQERERKDVLICHQTYDVCMKGLIPKMRPAKLLDPILFQLFHYCHTTWRDSAAPVRQELIDLSAHWTELGLQGPCPFSPTEAELKEHAQHYEDFETIQKLKLFLKSSLHTNSDGWVLNDAWDAAKDARRAANDEWIQTARESESRGEGLSIAKADKMWPFDAR